ncbi:ATP12 family chaperone protein [Prosthecomicrobium pneumaticum]|uniref:Chaperone required for assembly of F1-ATPase n=1 Tax=Prosthecomicrobium pneumaticum TaxID=81895 RepID=A0A7W9FNZ0_9HYPH|nr:ATP12 family protein [Prosthecomicrobium pneumaticum]MBB5754210.1 chaperone required for assembly of F1-ATPase [Prosthecomicrobium pneumaticum]
MKADEVDWFETPSATGNPVETARKLAAPARPKRFYERAAYEPAPEGFVLTLDGRRARTPARAPLAVAKARIAEALAAEWNAQGAEIDPAAMPLTRLVNSALDGVAREMAAVRAEIVRYAGSDLLCYRADGPQRLAELQTEHWDPPLAFLRERFGLRFVLAGGVVHVAQPDETAPLFDRALGDPDPLALAALSSITTLTGSAALALALVHGGLSADAAWTAAHVDEDYQASLWGGDEEASARRAARRREFDAAAFVLGAGG